MPSTTGSKSTTDHEEIRRWAEDRKAQPSCVRGTGDKNDVGMIRLDFPGYGDDSDSLQAISWDEWFEKFDERNLALVYQETTASGERSNFNKLVDRDSLDDSKAAHHGDGSHASHGKGAHSEGSHTHSSKRRTG